MRTIFAEYNPGRNSIDVYTSEILAEKQRQLDEFLATKGDSAEDGDTSEVSSEASVVSSEAAE